MTKVLIGLSVIFIFFTFVQATCEEYDQFGNISKCKATNCRIQGGACICSPCPTSKYFDENLCICKPCTDGCKNCNSASDGQCKECLGDFFEYKGTCKRNCPIGTFVDQQVQRCSQCALYCDTCKNENQCTTCQASRPFLFNFKCFRRCPIGTTTESSNILQCRGCSREICKNALVVTVLDQLDLFQDGNDLDLNKTMKEIKFYYQNCTQYPTELLPSLNTDPPLFIFSPPFTKLIQNTSNIYLVIPTDRNSSFALSNSTDLDIGIQILQFAENFTQPQPNDSESIKGVQNSSKTAATLASSSTNIMESVGIISSILSLDSSGASMRFAQNIKFISRLGLIFFYFGERFDAFLDEIAIKIAGSKLEEIPEIERLENGFKGKISYAYISLEFIRTMKYKLFMYLFSWILKISRMWLVLKRRNHSKLRRSYWIVWIINQQKSIHFVTFNIFLTDGPFFLIREE